ncbi:MAG: glutamine synthetase III [Sphingobacteriales bacterium]|jgi:glutamine synthetase|nr:glutamine synthetase III [Sphingobacteriales bacterium]MBP9142604.1 glutamine synthetase III [Chitinophagales bacterium]MDA0199509.1 glutamine synthetase III [Bacteroidota bacterium]MBK8679898.1 glutamine synthetase III [Sphingobacteriales bacterium]MBL0247452.1 glutamine synthetase III [Sphingobacteriales bacterium]
MSSTRFEAIETALHRSIPHVQMPSAKISDFFASHVFTTETMRKYLSNDAFISVMAAIETGNKISHELANQVAAAMKEWAMSLDATSFTHWFQPLTGSTAEKHETFFHPSFDHTKGMENFTGDSLVQQEPDGSSFPSGGLRATFEARGYTAWDPSSPAFVMTVGSAKTLCIPTIFVSYTGEALDYKVPLLRSQQFLQRAAVPVCQLFDKKVNRVFPTLGWEQEYFLIDAALYHARPDLVHAGRTLVGAKPPKGQQLDDHYFASIPERVHAYMLDFETEALKLGITITTRHNEVAPGQYECAPVFGEVNTAVDKNQLLMNIMELVAQRHGLAVLFHEKPFAGVNGSGKHNNWSLATNTGVNLLSPGKTPHNNLQFLTFFVNTIKALNDNADLLRAAIASAGNDHRLGANEAPPAIISAFIGSGLTHVLERFENNQNPDGNTAAAKLDIVASIPDLKMDNTDRNRTSPFAFTGNKFEFRAVGSSATCARPMIALNTIVAQQLVTFKKDVDGLISKKINKDEAIIRILQRYLQTSKRILFEGDNYTEEWATKAEKRGLSNVKDTPRALDLMIAPESYTVYVNNGIYTATELEAHYEVLLEAYQKEIAIEAQVLEEMATTQILPAAINYQNQLLANVQGLQTVGLKPKHTAAQLQLLKNISKHINGLQKQVGKLQTAYANAIAHEHARDCARAFCDHVKPRFDKIRHHADTLETLIADTHWPLPKYRELFFIK